VAGGENKGTLTRSGSSISSSKSSVDPSSEKKSESAGEGKQKPGQLYEIHNTFKQDDRGWTDLLDNLVKGDGDKEVLSILTNETKTKLAVSNVREAETPIPLADLNIPEDPYSKLILVTFTPEEGNYTLDISYNGTSAENRFVKNSSSFFA
jgi:hypothetical protein